MIGCADNGNRYLLQEKYFEQIDVFEQRSSVGGAWNYSPSSTKIGLTTSVPHVNPHEPAEKPIWIQQPGGNQEAVFVSPLYEKLETNIPKELMRYSDKPFPADTQLFPKHSAVKQYLEEYAEEVKSHIHFETQVVDVTVKDSKLSTWNLITTDLHTGDETTRTYDAIVVASGHYTVPHVPEIQGIEAWNNAYPGIISHSKYYNTPESFRDKKVLIVGSSASGLDIGGQINEVSKGSILVSQRAESYLAASAPGDKLIFPEIVEFLPAATHKRAIKFADGRVEDEVDAVVFCTGYFYSYPFLSSLQPAAVTHGWRAMNIYQQMFYIDHPTLVFPALAQRVIPFPIAENQAAVFARVWSSRLQLPSKADMHDWEAAEVNLKGDGKGFHLMHFPADADYLNFLYNWAAKAQERPGLDNDGQGKLGTCWGEKERWMRSKFPEIRRAFVQKGAQRSEIRTLAEVGFDFDQWKRENEQEI